MKLYSLIAVVAITTTITTHTMQPPRPQMYWILDSLLVNQQHGIDWNNVFGILDEMKSHFTVNEYRTPAGFSLLDIAVRMRNFQATKKLITEYYANPNTPNPLIGTTPLTHAIQTRNTPMVQLLLHYGANPYVVDQQNQTSFDWADIVGDATILQLLAPYRNQ